MSLLVLFNQPAAAIGASGAATDGQDVSAAGVGVSAAASSAATDNNDTTAAAAGPAVSASSAQTDGQDVTAASAGPVIGLGGSTVDGADSTSAGMSTLTAAIDFSSATVNGADTTRAGVELPAALGSGVALLGGGGAVKGWTKPEKGSYWDALLSPPKEFQPPLEPQPEAAPAQAQPIPIAVNTASQQAMRRSVQAAMRAAQMQALADLHQALITRQAAHARLLMDDDDEALLALLLA